ncbi:hypothetical protein SLS53_005488 [Cytospora paraplurivora]|uniref:Uncharacterized protein n=1 Tax=Cytospora paraplurivora TaxID=2898453 RepID=A0AAN9U702_9PEZI
MGDATPKSPDNITNEEFQDALSRTLSELSKFRYEEAPSLFALKKPSRPMQLDDVRSLVEWKLKHGKFRPTLMGLVSSNDESSVKNTIKDALDLYKQASDIPATIGILTKLRGIGPATASLLLAVHDPERVIFFSDEAFYWLCCHGKSGPIKYNAKEYRELSENARVLAERLEATAVDVERVAYVLMNDTRSAVSAKAPTRLIKKTAREGSAEPVSAKRKQSPVVDDGHRVLRSKRSKRA